MGRTFWGVLRSRHVGGPNRSRCVGWRPAGGRTACGKPGAGGRAPRAYGSGPPPGLPRAPCAPYASTPCVTRPVSRPGARPPHPRCRVVGRVRDLRGCRTWWLAHRAPTSELRRGPVGPAPWFWRSPCRLACRRPAPPRLCPVGPFGGEIYLGCSSFSAKVAGISMRASVLRCSVGGLERPRRAGRPRCFPRRASREGSWGWPEVHPPLRGFCRGGGPHRRSAGVAGADRAEPSKTVPTRPDCHPSLLEKICCCWNKNRPFVVEISFFKRVDHAFPW